MRRILSFLVLFLAVSGGKLHAQEPAQSSVPDIAPDPREGIWEGYDGEWTQVSKELISLAEAIPADKYEWRPGPGVRSVSEVIMHIAIANFYLLSITGPKMPPEMNSDEFEGRVQSKPEAIRYLKQSLQAVKTARSHLPGDLQRMVKVQGKTVPVDGCICGSSFTTMSGIRTVDRVCPHEWDCAPSKPSNT